MRKIISILILSLVSFGVFAQNASNENIENLEKDLTQYFTYPANDFLNSIDGLFEPPKMSIKKSKDNGINVQYVDYPVEDFQAIGVDEKSLAKDVNMFVEVAGKFFKKMPDKKGVVLSRMIYLPGYKKPFQIEKSKDKELNKYIKANNKEIADKSSCNQEGSCSTSFIMSFVYMDLTDYKTINNYVAEVFKFSDDNNLTEKANENKVYHKGTKNLKPVEIILIMGTNGQFVNPILATNLLALAKKDEDLSGDPSRMAFVGLVRNLHNIPTK